MSIFALILLAFAMSTDAFAAAIGKGVKINRPRLSFALKIGLLLSVFISGSQQIENSTSDKYFRW